MMARVAVRRSRLKSNFRKVGLLQCACDVGKHAAGCLTKWRRQMANIGTAIRASEAFKRPPLPKPHKSKTPIRASELVKRRHAEAMQALQRAINQREDLFVRIARLHSKIWKIARQVQRYEKLS
jgi:hypothetical protein